MKIKIPALINGLNSQQALDIAKDFLYWYEEFLIKNEPTAKNTIACIRGTIDGLPTEIKELEVSDGD